MASSQNVNWDFKGKPDLIVGTGASSAEKLLVYVISTLAGLVFVPLWAINHQPWEWWIYVICAAIAFDIVGGVVANATNSCKRFYHTASTPEEPGYVRFLKSGINFSLLHVHTILLAAIVPGASLFVGLAWYLGLIANVLIVQTTPLYLQRPVAFTGIICAMAINQYVLPLGEGLEWVIPLLFLKIVYGHTVMEEPYRPSRSGA